MPRYHYRKLEKDDFIVIGYDGDESNSYAIPTESGIKAYAEWNRSWFERAIDKQPMTFIQIVIALVQIAVTVAIAPLTAK